jgi:hypothetical protein
MHSLGSQVRQTSGFSGVGAGFLGRSLFGALAAVVLFVGILVLVPLVLVAAVAVVVVMGFGAAARAISGRGGRRLSGSAVAIDRDAGDDSRERDDVDGRENVRVRRE